MRDLPEDTYKEQEEVYRFCGDHYRNQWVSGHIKLIDYTYIVYIHLLYCFNTFVLHEN